MTITSLPAEGEFRIGNVFNRAANILFANFPFFFIVALIVALPSAVFQLQQGPRESVTDWDIAIIAFALIGGVLFSTIGQAIILSGAFQYLRGEPVRPGEAFQRGLAKLFPLLGLAILYNLGLGLGFALLLVPGLLLVVRWAVVIPACVVEGLGPIASMGRSARLTKGHRWKIFGTLALLMIINLLAYAIVGLMLGPAGPYAAVAGFALWQGGWGAFGHCVTIMIYHDLRVAKEGITSEQIAGVFD